MFDISDFQTIYDAKYKKAPSQTIYDTLKSLISDEIIDKYESLKNEYLEILKRFKDKELIKVITGLRRCGKSTLLEILFRLVNNLSFVLLKDIPREAADNLCYIFGLYAESRLIRGYNNS